MDKQSEGIQGRVAMLLQKYHGNIDEYRERHGKAEGERRFYAEHQPYEERREEGNLLLNVGCYELLQLLTGAGGTVFDAAESQIGVGNSNQVAAYADTDLVGGSTDYHGMEALYPDIGVAADRHIHFKSSFGSGHAEWAWEEWVVDNKAGAGTACLNRKVVSLGTKPALTTWTLTVTISFV